MAAWEKDRIDHYEGERLRELFVGRRVIAAEDGVLTLDDGTRAKVEPNEGCGGCPSGWYELERIATAENVITAVSVEDEEITGDPYGDDARYRLFVYAAGVDAGTELLSVKGSDGNGYYGTGFSLIVKRENEEN